jgi:hypothetical protein
MAKHTLTTPELRMRIRSLRSMLRTMEQGHKNSAIDRYLKKQFDAVRWELQDCRTIYYSRQDKSFDFIKTDVMA